MAGTAFPGGHHEAAWRYPGGWRTSPNYTELAKRAEAAKLDAIFFADGPVRADNTAVPPASSWSRWPPWRRNRTDRPHRHRLDDL
ncbi:hypothetical protein [Paenirhodobacter sp.]|uniref:hypothetical protein n=1 Tax=Paenirhodobacter sp. TaxID=1965326 RepID=UPI003B4253B5